MEIGNMDVVPGEGIGSEFWRLHAEVASDLARDAVQQADGKSLSAGQALIRCPVHYPAIVGQGYAEIEAGLQIARSFNHVVLKPQLWSQGQRMWIVLVPADEVARQTLEHWTYEYERYNGKARRVF